MSSLSLPCQRVKQRLLKQLSYCTVHVPRPHSNLHANTHSHIRCVSSSLPANAKDSSVEHNPMKPRVEEDEEEGDAEENTPTSQAAYHNWLANQGRHFKNPSFTGPKWLGGNVPFPLNPTFKPPSPLSDRVRDTIYRHYISNPAENDLRSLSIRYGISIPRIEAILKLKALEAQWKDPGTSTPPLQTGFQRGMEMLLGTTGRGTHTSLAEELNSPARDAVKDADEAAAATAAAAQEQTGTRHLSRTYFEPVDEGQQPVVPTLIAEARSRAKSKRDALSTVKPTSEYPSHVVQPDPNRPAFRFVDVGLKWFDSVDAAKRQKESQRRKSLKERRQKLGTLSKEQRKARKLQYSL